MKKIDRVDLRYGIEIAVGLASFLALLAWGEPGFAVFSLLAVLAVLKPRRLDERERRLVAKANTGTLALVYGSMFAVYYLLPRINWLCALAGSFVFFHGLCGLLVFKLGTVDRPE